MEGGARALSMQPRVKSGGGGTSPLERSRVADESLSSHEVEE